MMVENPSIPNPDEYLAKLRRFKDLQKEKEHRRQLGLQEARGSFPSFLERVMKDEASGSKIKLAEIHLSWIEHLHYSWSRGLHAAILAPYGAGKTAIMGVGLPLFSFGVDPSLRITLISANDTIAQERLVLVRQYIDYSDEYHELFPNVRADPNMGWTQRRLYLQRPTYSKDASLTASGAVGSIIGKRNDIFIFDDINDAKNTIQQPKSRETIWTKFTGEYLSRLEPGGKIVIIATRWHERDLIGSILADKDMRRAYAFLIQRVTDDFNHIECERIVPANMPEKIDHRVELAHLFQLHENRVI